MSTGPGRILIADDDEMVRLIARAVVERAGMTVIEATDGAEALAIIEGDEPLDLVLLDLDMPVVGGLDVLRAVRDNPARSRLPVLILSGAEGDEVHTAMSLGAAGIFPKPIAAERLLTRIREFAR